MLNKDEMREQYKEAISLLEEVASKYISHEKWYNGECEDKEEIMEALKLISKLVEKTEEKPNINLLWEEGSAADRRVAMSVPGRNWALDQIMR